MKYFSTLFSCIASLIKILVSFLTPYSKLFAVLLAIVGLLVFVCFNINDSSTFFSGQLYGMGPIKKENISGTEATKTTDLSETNFESNKPNVERQNYSHDIQRAIEYIEQSEYFIRCQELPGELQSPNRKNNMRFSFNNNGFEAQPRVDSSCEWHIAFHLKGLYRGDKLIEGTQTFTRESIDENRLVYEHAGYDVEYINDSKGMRQNFIVAQKPLGDEDLAIRMEVESRNLQLSCTNNEISGKSDDNIVYQYKDLKVWDANEKLLSAMMKLEGNALSIIVDDRTATYPITIDPLSSTPANILEGDQENARFGFSVSSAGDVNGDGFSDVVVGASNYDNGETDEGAAFVYHGSALGISTTAAAMLESDQENATFGFSVSSAGDVNGDSYSDVMVGASNYDNGETDEGAAFIYHGSSSGISTTAAVTLESNQENARFGYSLASAGNVNGDGYSDVVVGAYLYENGQNNEGAAFVFHGSASGISITAAVILESNQASAEFGYSVASAGDVNGDGYSDVVVGAHLYGNGETGEGAAFVYHGSVMGTSNTAAVILESNQESAYSGISVGSAGDVNGDGYSDLVVGAYLYDNGQNNEGVALVYHGSASGINTTVAALVESNQANSQFGISVASAGDVNGDGYSDIVVGAFLYDNGQNNEGAAFVYHGSSSGISTTASAILESNQVAAILGYSVASAGDVNGDGYSDVVVGAYFYDNGQTDEGAAFIYHGAASGVSTTAAATLESNQENARFGYSVASAGDVNGDGYSDVVVGAYLYENGQNNEGAAFVFHGSASGISINPAVILEGNQASAEFGYSVASAGDVNGDGYSDVVVGAHLYGNGETGEGAAFVYHGSVMGTSNTAAAILESNQESAYSGISVGSAGDVNGDGYSDLVVGAYLYDNGQNNEGVALIYHGSASGINTTVAALVESNQANSQFGISVASAGDVNGDGFSDIVVGAFLYDNGQNNEGAAFVYHGSISGISTTTTALLESNQVGATLGYSVASAGDVNGDGYSDVVVGAYFYDNGQTDEGVAFIYLGSTLGISSTAATTLEGDQENARYGYSVASAGDVNGDGYSDVLVGASYYHNGETNEGAAFIYHGSSFGINITATAILESNQENAQLGNSIASAGDVNGDGYSDVLVGASYYHNGETDEGASFIFHGNAGGGLLRNIRAFNSNTNTAIQQSNILENDFSLGLFSKNFLGRTKGKLVWETKQQGEPFSSDGGSITNSVSFTADGVFSDLGISGINLTDLISKPGTQTKVRVRLKFDPVTAITGQALGPWQYLPEYTRGAQGMSSNPLKEQQPPIITSFTPTFGCANVGSVTINGANFMNATSVKIGGTNVSSFNVNSDTEIEAIIGSGTTGTIEVVSLAGTGFSVATFTVNPPSIYNSTDNMYYCTITDALAATMTNDGDLIEIPAGTYIEPCMLIDKSVVIKPMGSVTIDCLEMNGTGKIMVLDGDITLNILNLTNGLIRTNGHNLKCGTISGASIDSYVVTD
ncbi:MAG: FG-GAP repeat protein [Saprospiraceae bacterium]|nr:FG-GAP repeat protein [Saprospiraceae bacterium]